MKASPLASVANAASYETTVKYIPLLAEEGWTRPQQMLRSHLIKERTGWSVRPKSFAGLTTPSAPSLRSAHPPLCEEGNVHRPDRRRGGTDDLQNDTVFFVHFCCRIGMGRCPVAGPSTGSRGDIHRDVGECQRCGPRCEDKRFSMVFR